MTCALTAGHILGLFVWAFIQQKCSRTCYFTRVENNTVVYTWWKAKEFPRVSKLHSKLLSTLLRVRRWTPHAWDSLLVIIPLAHNTLALHFPGSASSCASLQIIKGFYYFWIHRVILEMKKHYIPFNYFCNIKVGSTVEQWEICWVNYFD